MKAQLTLETIIMLVVLLVLAGVMITLILSTLKPPAAPERVLSKQEFLSQCENYCNDPEKQVEYCRLYWKGRDWNQNNIPSELIQVGSYNWYACEDRIYCFLVQPCERLGTGLELLQRCKELLCGIYLDKYGDSTIATQKLKIDIGFSKTCGFSNVPEYENWYKKVFESGCVGVTEGEVVSGVSLQRCEVDEVNKKIECLTNCISPTPPGLVIVGEDKNGNELIITASPTIKDGRVSLVDSRLENINCQKDINVVLMCKTPEGEGIASAICK